MAGSAMACQVLVAPATCGRLHCNGSQLKSSSSLDRRSLGPSSQKCRFGLLQQKSTDRQLRKKRRKLRVVMQVDPARSSTTLSPAFAAISLPFGKNATASLTAAPAEPETETHVVQRGQVMSTIARLYNTDLKTLHELNPGVALDYVRPKQKIIVPKVRGGGETKSGVATEAAVGQPGVPDICVPKGELMLTRTHFHFL
jgi:LysM repeat protein